MNKIIIPAILTESVADLQSKIELSKSFCKRICVDMIDGEFADNITVMPEDLQNVSWQGLIHEAQLMVTEPIDYLGFLHTAGFKRAYGHVERMGDIETYLQACEDLAIEPGLALDVYTPIESIPQELRQRTAGILLMSVKAGFSSQKYIDISQKVKDLRKSGYAADIQVDGGMNVETIPTLVSCGVNQFSVTSAIWSAPDAALSYQALTALL